MQLSVGVQNAVNSSFSNMAKSCQLQLHVGTYWVKVMFLEHALHLVGLLQELLSGRLGCKGFKRSILKVIVCVSMRPKKRYLWCARVNVGESCIRDTEAKSEVQARAPGRCAFCFI